MPLDESKLNELVQKMVGDVGAMIGGALVIVGDKLGLYKALAEHGAMTSTELAGKTGTAERYVREWLAAQAAAGYITLEAGTARYSLTPEQRMVFADEGGPAFFPGAFEVASSAFLDEPKVSAAFKSGAGIGWHERNACLFRGTERFFRPGYAARLVQNGSPPSRA